MITNKPTLQLLLVTARYFPYMGGIETHNYEVARRLAQRGVDVTVLTTDPSNRLAAAEEVEGVHVRRVRAWPAERDYYFAPDVYKVVADGPWDLIHCQGVHTLVPPLAMLAARRAKVPYVITFHTGGHSSHFRNSIRGLQWTVLHPLLARAAHYVGVSRFEIDYFRRRLLIPDDRCSMIPNGSDLPAEVAPAAIGDDITLIISIGRIERYKGHHRLIAALPQIRQQIPTARLLILGAGPYEQALRELAQSLSVADHVEIRMIPAHQRQEMAAVLARADLVTLMSEAESNPVAVMEALALGRSVLVADNSGFRELAQRGLLHAIPLESTPDELAQAMVEQLHNPLQPRKVELPTWDDCTDELLSVYRSVVNNPSSTIHRKRD